MSIRKTKLWSIVSPYDSWFNSLGKNEEAKLALKLFINEYNSQNIDKVNSEYNRRYIFAIKEAIQEEKYERACNEICSLMFYTTTTRDSKFEENTIFAENISIELNKLLGDL